MNNTKFEAYYTKQLAMEDDEWCKFLDICRESLPSTFRICGNRECVCSSLPLVSPLEARMIKCLYQDGSCAHLCSRENLHPATHWRRVRRSTYSRPFGLAMVSTNSG